MTIDQLIGIASDGPLDTAVVGTAAKELGLSLSDVFSTFAKRVAQGYLRGEYWYTVGDAAMNNLFAFAYAISRTGLPDIALQVYEAFDEGEYDHVGEREELQGEVRTKTLLARVPDLSDA